MRKNNFLTYFNINFQKFKIRSKMELFDILSTIHDLSQKGAEFNEEIQQLSLTCMTLGTALENIGKIQKKSKK